MNQLEIHWGATARQITLVMSAIGVGRLLMLYFSGYFSDKFGRKKTSILAMLSHVIFFVGLLFSPNYSLAAAVSIMVVPYITGILSEISVSAIFWFDFSLILLGLTVACITNVRYTALPRRENRIGRF